MVEVGGKREQRRELGGAVQKDVTYVTSSVMEIVRHAAFGVGGCRSCSVYGVSPSLAGVAGSLPCKVGGRGG